MESVDCECCRCIIARLVGDEMSPTAETCYLRGRVPVPNFRWFCSQSCADRYEKEYGVAFQRTADGRIDYYQAKRQ